MTHAPGIAEDLTRYADGGLDEKRRREVEEHLAGCAECAAWVATHRLLAGALGAAAAHLSSDEVARWALAAESLAGPARERAGRHLATCGRCADEVELVRAAAAAANEERPAATGAAVAVLAPRPRRAATWRPLAWAAGLVLAVAIALVARSIGLPLGVPLERELHEATLTAPATLEARNAIRVEATGVEAGADLTLKSGSIVVFGDGFHVDSGGSLSVLVDSGNGS